MVIDWSVVSDNLVGVPVVVVRLAQFLAILLVFWVAFVLVRSWLEKRRQRAGWDDRTLDHHCALARAIVLIAGLILAGVTVGLVAADPVFKFLGALFGGAFSFLGTVVHGAFWAAGLCALGLAIGLAFGARQAVLGLLGGLVLKSKRSGAEQLPQPGARVRLGEAQGVFEGFSLLKTRLRQADGSLLLLSNAWVLDDQPIIVVPTAPGVAS